MIFFKIKKCAATLIFLIGASMPAHSLDLAGNWDCELVDTTEATDPDLRLIDSVSLAIGDGSSTYIRKADSRWESISNPSIALHTQSTEVGVLVVDGVKIKFSPLKGDVKILESGVLDPKELEQDILEGLMTDEDWVIKDFSTEQVVFTRPGTGYIDTCIRSRVK